ncbi:hypothetical protein [Chiayiivirga flava]|uniref:Uncharacterized protein n=1 Tax=Chiayiivirga flava TaxID=659595 RepID=A0A7W8D898_9GAMM|nr:hypothetical protein [Chiayiivirga flava]MBB5208607.1 hypothetical protein [Chiayiivirga flava]
MPTFGPRPRLRRRVLGLVVAVHLVVLITLLWPPAPRDTSQQSGLRIEFINVPATAPAPPPQSPSPRRAATRPAQASMPRAAPAPAPQSAPPSDAALQAVEVAPRTSAVEAVAARAALFDDTGSIVVPDAAIEELRRNVADDRVFDYQIAGLAKAATAFDRASPLVYEPSRFEAGMRPTQDMLTELLDRAVAATTMSVSIPIPGDPHRRIECKVAILAMGGGCGMTGFTGFVEEDDPDTLNPEEEAQCAAWWEKITTATQQQAWLQTRKLYDANCRKPPETRPRLPDRSESSGKSEASGE